MGGSLQMGDCCGPWSSDRRNASGPVVTRDLRPAERLAFARRRRRGVPDHFTLFGTETTDSLGHQSHATTRADVSTLKNHDVEHESEEKGIPMAADAGWEPARL